MITRAQPAQATVSGLLFPIRLHPDPINDDRITIGVAFVDAAGITHCRLATHYEGLSGLYGGIVDVASFDLAARIVTTDLQGARWEPGRASPVANITFGPALPQRGLSAREILDRAFAATVRFGAAA